MLVQFQEGSSTFGRLEVEEPKATSATLEGPACPDSPRKVKVRVRVTVLKGVVAPVDLVVRTLDGVGLEVDKEGGSDVRHNGKSGV